VRPDPPRALLATRVFAVLLTVSVLIWALEMFGPLCPDWAPYTFMAGLTIAPMFVVSLMALREARRMERRGIETSPSLQVPIQYPRPADAGGMIWADAGARNRLSDEPEEDDGTL
jgi:hypothetical protein